MAWLDANTLAEKEEFDDHLKDAQRVIGPVMGKIHGQGGGAQAGGNTQGGNTHGGSAGTGRGPTVEEVD